MVSLKDAAVKTVLGTVDSVLYTRIIARRKNAGYTYNMKQTSGSNSVIAILAVTAALLVVSFAFLLVGQEKIQQKALLEFKTFQVLTSVLDMYNGEGTFDSAVWPEVAGFALYSSSGQAIYRFGSAPLFLKERPVISQQGFFAFGKKTLVMIRPIGDLPLPRVEGGLLP